MNFMELIPKTDRKILDQDCMFGVSACYSGQLYAVV